MPAGRQDLKEDLEKKTEARAVFSRKRMVAFRLLLARVSASTPRSTCEFAGSQQAAATQVRSRGEARCDLTVRGARGWRRRARSVPPSPRCSGTPRRRAGAAQSAAATSPASRAPQPKRVVRGWNLRPAPCACLSRPPRAQSGWQPPPSRTHRLSRPRYAPRAPLGAPARWPSKSKRKKRKEKKTQQNARPGFP